MGDPPGTAPPPQKAHWSSQQNIPKKPHKTSTRTHTEPPQENTPAHTLAHTHTHTHLKNPGRTPRSTTSTPPTDCLRAWRAPGRHGR
eukprot:6391210-Alexandrium_andersonii.AAC.1